MNNLMWGAAFLINKVKSIMMTMIILFPNKSAGVGVRERRCIITQLYLCGIVSVWEAPNSTVTFTSPVFLSPGNIRLTSCHQKKPSTAHIFSCSGENPGNSQRWRLILEATVHVISFSSKKFASVLKPSVWITPMREVNTHRVGPN